MPRSVNHVASRAKRKSILKLTRGYFGARKNVWTVAKNTWEKGLTYAYRDRRNKKRAFRSLWIQRINAAARINGLSYSQLMGALNYMASFNLQILRMSATTNCSNSSNDRFLSKGRGMLSSSNSCGSVKSMFNSSSLPTCINRPVLSNAANCCCACSFLLSYEKVTVHIYVVSLDSTSAKLRTIIVITK